MSNPEPSPPPPMAHSLASEMNLPANISQAESHDQIIDVLPDTRVTIRAMIYYILKEFPSFDVKSHPLVSPNSILSYCLIAFYTVLLYSDHEDRKPMSQSASFFMTNEKRESFYRQLLEMKVPKFLEEFILPLFATSFPQRPKVHFVPTLASFKFSHDAPRIIPPSLPLIIHNVIATLSSRTEPHVIRNILNHKPILDTPGTNPFQFRIGNFLGTNYADNQTINTYPNWFNKSLDKLLNPVTMRSNQNRIFYDESPFSPPTYHATNLNPYVYALMADYTNVSNTSQFVASLSKFFDSIPGSKTLKDIIGQRSGSNILSHSYSIFPLPTYNFSQKVAEGNSTSAPTPRTTADFATLCRYLSSPNQPVEDLTTFTQTIYSALTHTIRTLLPLAPSTEQAEDHELVEFDLDEHVHPPFLFLDPDCSTVTKLYSTIIHGIKIESFEIDSFGVPLPNTDATVRTNNSMLLQSAVPLRLIRNSLNDDLDHVIKRHRPSYVDQPVNYFLKDMSRVIFGRLKINFITPLLSISSYFNSTPAVTHKKNIINVRAYRINEAPSDTAPKLLAWSSYRFIANEGSNSSEVYMLLNMRNLFGTNIPASEMEFPPLFITI